MKNLSVRTQLLALVILAVVGFLALGGMVLRSEYLALRAASVDKLTTLTESALYIIRHYEEAASQGQMGEADAKVQAKRAVMASRYGKDGYFFIFDAQLNYVGHPLKPALDGTSVYKLKDAKGRNLGELFAKAVADGSGLASYDWIKPGDSDETEKISKVLRSQRWHWVVGTGQHIEDINREIWHSAINLLVIMGLGTLLLLLAGMAIARNIVRQLGGEPVYAAEVVASIASGNLNTPIIERGQGLLSAIAGMQTQLRTMVGQVAEQANRLMDMSKGLSGHVEHLSTAAQSQSESASAMAASVEQMTVSINEIASHAGEARDISQNAGQQSHDSGQVVRRAAEEMAEINGSVEAASHTLTTLVQDVGGISSIVEVIRDVADQTNLLALNAAIEAARAGEQGRGFAVVADEVRKLAERTAKATGEITDRIQRIQHLSGQSRASMDAAVQRMTDGVTLAREGGEAIATIESHSNQVVATVNDISLALKEQSLASNDIAQRIEQMARGAGDTAMAVQAAAQASSEMHAVAASLQTSVRGFRT